MKAIRKSSVEFLSVYPPLCVYPPLVLDHFCAAGENLGDFRHIMRLPPPCSRPPPEQGGGKRIGIPLISVPLHTRKTFPVKICNTSFSVTSKGIFAKICHKNFGSKSVTRPPSPLPPPYWDPNFAHTIVTLFVPFE